MKILLVVGGANDIFITNMTKWLKKSLPDSQIDIFSFYDTNKQVKNTYSDNIQYVNSNVWHQKIPGLRNLIAPYYGSYIFKKFLKDRHYDIIQCHWIIPQLVLTRDIHKHCNKLFATFWGGELCNFKILNSNKTYKKNLDKFVQEIDYIINSKSFKSTIQNLYPQLTEKHIEGYLGSAAVEELYKLMEIEDKAMSKEIMSIEPNKKVILIGYSGKSLHQHIPIINELTTREDLKRELHLLAPMTRGANNKYCDDVQKALDNSGYSYTLLRNRFLMDEEVARLRNITDITLQFSTTDGFSRSIIECLCAKSVLIYGNWLNYEPHLINNNFKAHSVSSIKEGIDKLTNIIRDFEQYKEEIEKNSVNGKSKHTWSACIKDWINAYTNKK